MDRPIIREVLEQYAKKMTDADIAKVYGCSHGTIANHRYKWGIPCSWEYKRTRDGHKICSWCEERKPISEFYKASHSYDGYAHRCKECSKEYRERRRIEERHREWASQTIYTHKKRGNKILSDLTVDWLDKYAQKTKCCEICEEELEWKPGRGLKLSSPTLDRVDNEDFLTQNNVMIICLSCNGTKRDRTMSDFVSYCEMITKRFG
jgi:hypothetical protein